MRFLIIDNSPTMRRVLINTLKSFGYSDFVEAEDGKEGLLKLNAEKFDFVITDWMLPNMTGIELTKIVRTDDNLKDIPILMISSRGLKTDIVEALKAKVSNYMVKPFDPKVLREKIDAILVQIK